MATITTALPTTSGAPSGVIAILSENHTTLTASEIAGTTGLAVVDGTTLTWRQQGITLSDGDVVSLGYDGLVDSTTTALYQAITGVPASGSDNGSAASTTHNLTAITSVTSSGRVSTILSISGSKTPTTSVGQTGAVTSGTPAATSSGGGSGVPSAASQGASAGSTTTTSGASQICAGKVMMLLALALGLAIQPRIGINTL